MTTNQELKKHTHTPPNGRHERADGDLGAGLATKIDTDDTQPLTPRAMDERLRPIWAGPTPDVFALLDSGEADRDVSILDRDAALRGLWGMAEWSLGSPEPEVRAMAMRLLDLLEAGAPQRMEAWLGLSEAGRGGSMTEAMMMRTRDALLRQLHRSERYAQMNATSAGSQMAMAWKRFAALRRAPRQDDPGERVFAEIAKMGGQPLAASTIRDVLLRKSSA